MKIYFAAHGTSTHNDESLASGWSDPELSELGITQAKELGETFKNISIDLVCCSDLRRAVDTVKLAFGDSIPVIIDKRLRELNYGDFNGKSTEEVGWRKKKYISEPFLNGESYEQASKKAQEFYKGLKEKYSDKTVLVVGHRATQFALDNLILGKSLEECLSVPFKWQPYWEYDY